MLSVKCNQWSLSPCPRSNKERRPWQKSRAFVPGFGKGLTTVCRSRNCRAHATVCECVAAGSQCADHSLSHFKSWCHYQLLQAASKTPGLLHFAPTQTNIWTPKHQLTIKMSAIGYRGFHKHTNILLFFFITQMWNYEDFSRYQKFKLLHFESVIIAIGCWSCIVISTLSFVFVFTW